MESEKIELLREAPTPHECVCCLTKKGPALDPEAADVLRRAAEAAGIPQSSFQTVISHQDKCHAEVDNSDQPFCDYCEESGHHLLPNQLGMQNFLKENQ